MRIIYTQQEVYTLGSSRSRKKAQQQRRDFADLKNVPLGVRRSGNGEQNGQGTAALHRGHRHAHCDGEGCRKQAAEHQYRPPGGGVRDYSEFFGTLLSEPPFRVG
jgi:hypothetical protein